MRFIYLCLICLHCSLCALPLTEYCFTHEPIDVVIPCADKDIELLDYCIDSIRTYGKNIRRIIVVSPRPLTDTAEWYDENKYPFSLEDIGREIFPSDPAQAHWFAFECTRRGWVYQQLLKLYAPLVIPGISSNVLILDADVVFFRPIQFLTDSGAGLYTVGGEYFLPYFEHMHRLLPGLTRVFPSQSGISHHMLFQKSVIESLFADIRAYHHKEPWQALCNCINPQDLGLSSLSEYEIYFNYLFSTSNQAQTRHLNWRNGGVFSEQIFSLHAQEGAHYTAYHHYARPQGEH